VGRQGLPKKKTKTGFDHCPTIGFLAAKKDQRLIKKKLTERHHDGMFWQEKKPVQRSSNHRVTLGTSREPLLADNG